MTLLLTAIKDKWGRTRNWADSLNIYPESFGNGYQPTFEIEKLGGVIQQGLIGYITVGASIHIKSLSNLN